MQMRLPSGRRLAQGLRLVLILVLPAAVILTGDGRTAGRRDSPTRQFLARRHARHGGKCCGSPSWDWSLPPLDQPLIVAFLRPHDTWTPALVGVATVIFYFGLALVPTWLHEPRMWELILANSLKLTAHALMM
jgi:hypothetical protein